MSDLAALENLSKLAPQLPATWYFDPSIAQVEEERLFRQGPGYVGHELMVPNRGDFHVLDPALGAKALVRGDAGIELLTNVCRHRQAVMLRGRGNTANIVCPLHRWTYDLSGRLIGAPHFDETPCLDLGKTPLRAWNGMLFEGPRDPAADLANLGVIADIDFSGYVYDHAIRHDYDFNWKTFVEVYLEDYHVVPFHPGLGQLVDCNDLKWEFGDWYSVQTVGLKDGMARPGTPVYKRYHDAILTLSGGVLPRHGAIWMVLFPNVMIEWYPNVLVVSGVWPNGPEKCVNICEFFYPEEVALFERELVEAERAAYQETAVEDEEICLRMTEGRRHLIAQGIEQFGPYQLPTELGMRHFHMFIRRQLQQVV